MVSVDYEKHLSMLKRWVNRLGYKVKLTDQDMCWEEDKLVEIDKKHSAVEKVVALAHEIGHIKNDKKLLNIFPGCMTYHSSPLGLQVEFEAWVEADKIARRRGFFNKDYIIAKRDSLKEYYIGGAVFHWCQERGLDIVGKKKAEVDQT